jgi:type IV pilus assembly protein PilA
MRTIRRLIEAKKLEREENGESGFSLIELIIVVVILGILVAIAIPIFGNIQTTARQNATEAAAANGATAVATAIANGKDAAGVDAAAKSAGSGDISVAVATGGSRTDATEVCVTATNKSGEVASSGTKDGCTTNNWDEPATTDTTAG